jgi:hypothetical protein
MRPVAWKSLRPECDQVAASYVCVREFMEILAEVVS